MEQIIQYLLLIHILSGAISLVSGLIAIFAPKVKEWHRYAGKVYFFGMTMVFITGISIAGYKFNRFLFLIAFLSYYSVFSGVRFLKLKKLHKDQRPKWFDWFAGGVNLFANLIFVGLGVLYFFNENANSGAALLSLGFGFGGIVLSINNMKPFFIKPEKGTYWYPAHIGNMMGGYIATTTAFLSTVVSRYDVMNPMLAFALPSLIGVPLLIYWTRKVRLKMG
jgi:uncharacterized membrane protein